MLAVRPLAQTSVNNKLKIHQRWKGKRNNNKTNKNRVDCGIWMYARMTGELFAIKAGNFYLFSQKHEKAKIAQQNHFIKDWWQSARISGAQWAQLLQWAARRISSATYKQIRTKHAYPLKNTSINTGNPICSVSKKPFSQKRKKICFCAKQFAKFSQVHVCRHAHMCVSP